MPEEVAIIAVVAILGGTVSSVAKYIVDYLKSKNAASVSGASMTTSELQAMLKASVLEVTEPLKERITYLEDRVDAMGERGEDLLGDMDSYESSTEKSAASRRTRA